PEGSLVLIRFVDRFHFTKCGRTCHHTDGAVLPGATHMNMVLCAAGSTHSGLHGSQPASANHSAHSGNKTALLSYFRFFGRIFFKAQAASVKKSQGDARKLRAT